MLKVQRRIDKLEKALGLSDRKPSVEHRIDFVDADGTVSETLLIAEGRMEWVVGEVAEEAG